MLPPSSPPAAPEDAPATPSVYAYQELGPQPQSREAALADEMALAISYNGISHTVMMVSRNDLEDFVTGFSLSHRIIDHPDDIRDMQFQDNNDACVAQVEISSRALWQLKQHRRQLMGSSGCGICGVEALEQAMPELEPLSPAPVPPPTHFAELRERVQHAQTLGRNSGALHAALYLDESGNLRFCREDIGRHNALDKLIGALARAHIDPHRGVAVITSRCGLELVHKAVRAGMGTVATLSAPSSATVRWARHYRLNLIHVPHQSPPRLYSPAP